MNCIRVNTGTSYDVLIRHGNYISVYCNLSSASVKSGDTVKTKQHIGQVFSAAQIYENVWNENADFSVENTVMVHIRHIREKIEINPKEPRYLKVVWGIGYKFEVK